MRILTSAAAIAMLAVPALAQDQSGGDAQQIANDFFNPIADEATSAVQSGNWKGIAGWMSENTADEAPFYFAGTALSSEGPAAAFTMAIDASELEEFAMQAGGMQGMTGDMIDDYDLEVMVRGAWQVPDNRIGAEVAFYESGTLNPPEGMDMPSGPFTSATICTVRLSDVDDDAEIEMATCMVTAMM
ncbi:hypothetical protein BCF33_1158 [Hasllibacter halocynthiae]|uniref:Uncharacterized protein n=1 Tax=Hasllibacter halocynthiae TaxID=595589 RepID=A0A2T0X9D5_9RHOB|nr:hypothetical protein [Hasllibacter halocynthiae]PRY95537.1 hypothetical protein BCF33_1158 [Hasllibacter halocynthiae]